MSDASREAFEKWARRTGFDLSLSFDLELVPEGYYGSATTRSAWNAWQAALQSGEPVIDVDALLNEMSCLYWYAYDKGHDDTVEDCFTEVHSTKLYYFWADRVKRIASEGYMPMVNAMLSAGKGGE